MGCGRDDGGKLRVCIRAREGSWQRTLGACVKLVQEQGMGTVEGCVCIVPWGRELYVIVMDLLDVIVHMYDCDCITKS